MKRYDSSKYTNIIFYIDKFYKIYMFILADRYDINKYFTTFLLLRNTIIKIANKERNAISAWVEQNPDWMDTETTQMEYLTLINKICEPIENDIKNEKKIIKIIGKEIILNKDSEKQFKQSKIKNEN
jgi:hypothetical protein